MPTLLFWVITPCGVVGPFQLLWRNLLPSSSEMLYVPTGAYGASAIKTNVYVMEFLCGYKVFTYDSLFWEAVTWCLRLKIKNNRKVYSNGVPTLYKGIFFLFIFYSTAACCESNSPHMFMKYPTSYGTWKCTAVFMRARSGLHLSQINLIT
jgi:hypothetical protein